MSDYEAIVIGVSAGGMEALSMLVPRFAVNFPVPVIIVQHRPYNRDDFLVEYLNDHSDIEVTEAQCNEKISAQRVYIAPGGYHLQVEKNRFFSLSLDEKVNNSIPSIDVLFETAADCYADKLIGIILTGANCDGANGLKAIRDAGGYAIVEQPETAHTSFMPACALKTAGADAILPLKKISDFLLKKITT